MIEFVSSYSKASDQHSAFDALLMQLHESEK